MLGVHADREKTPRAPDSLFLKKLEEYSGKKKKQTENECSPNTVNGKQRLFLRGQVKKVLHLRMDF